MTTRLNITPEEYHARDEISSSGLRCLDRDGAPDYYAQYIVKASPETNTDAMRLGTCTHILFETPGKWQERIRIVPSKIDDEQWEHFVNLDLDLKDSKAKRLKMGDPINMKLPSHRLFIQWAREDAEAEGKVWCTEAEAEMFVGQLEAILAEPNCRKIVEQGGNREQAAINTHKGTGLAIRALADVDNPGVYGTDLKTTKERSALGFYYDARKRGYHLQLAHYENVFDWENSGIIAVTNKFPYYALHYEFTPEMKQQAAEKVDHTMSDLASRMEGDWQSVEAWRIEEFGRTVMMGVDGINEPSGWEVVG